MIANKIEFRDLWNKEGLYEHQEFVRRFISPYTPYRGLLLFHSLGSGKTLTCISICVDHYEIEKRKSVIITRSSHGHHVFQTEIRKYQTMHGPFNQKNIFTMNSYIELNNKLKEMTDEEIRAKYSNTLIVMDEIHNVRGNEIDVSIDSVYSQLRRLTGIPKNIKVILSTATPMTDNVRQIEPIMSLLGKDRYISYNDTVKQVAKVTFHGQKIYENLPQVQAIPMSAVQEQNYLSITVSHKQHDVYKTNSQVSLFCTRDKLYGNKIRSEIMLKEKRTVRVEPYDLKHKIITYAKYKVNVHHEDEITTNLYDASCKYKFFLDYLQDRSNQGTMFVFIEDVVGSGVEILTEILELAGYSLYLGDDITKLSKRKRYTFCVGDTEMCPNIEHRIEGFSHPDNKDGEYVKVMIGSKVMSESVTVKNTRHFHCITPHWNNTVTSQALGRILRTGSHNDLPPASRTVQAFIYCATLKAETSIDARKLQVSNDKLVAINKEISRMKKMSIETYVDHHCEPDTSTFIQHYLSRYEDRWFPKLDALLAVTQSVEDIKQRMGIHPDITKQLIIRTVVSRRSINNRFLSMYNKKLLLHAHPDFSLVSSNAISSKTHPESYASVVLYADLPDIDQKIDFEDVVAAIRNMAPVQVQHMLERAVAENRPVGAFRYVLYRYKKYILHTISYTKNYKSSYKAAIPIPTAPTGGLRGFDLDRKTWVDLPYREELEAMDYLRNKLGELIYSKINQLLISGILSTIDGEIRLCIKLTEFDTGDTRIKHRGRMISTFVKEDLITLATMLSSDDIMDTLTDKYNKGYRVSSLKELSITPSFPLRYTMQELKKIIEANITKRDLLFIL
jgi:hypothetical protein